MKPRLKTTRAARDLIKAHEPFLGEAIQRGRRWVIGYGHTAAAKPGMSLNEDDAELLLVYDVMQAEQAVVSLVGEDAPEPVKNALISFAASVGLNAFKVSDVGRLARSGKFSEAGAALESWVRAEEDGRLVTSQRLLERRAAEKDLLLSGLQPSPVETQDVAEPIEANPVDAEPVEANQVEESQAEDTSGQDDEPRLGPLVDVEIEIEDFEDHAEDLEAVAEDESDQDVSDDATQSVEPEQTDEASDLAEGEAQLEDVAETELAPQTGDEGDQDSAIERVMARMTEDIARSVDHDDIEAPVLDEPRNQDVADDMHGAERPRLGYYFLRQDFIDLNRADDPAESTDGDLARSESAESESVDVSSPESAQPSVMPGPVYGSVSVAPAAEPEPTAPEAPSDTAELEFELVEDVLEEESPPHPGEAPAQAQGLSGEAEGPDHKDETAEGQALDDDEELVPTIVSGEALDGFSARKDKPKKSGGNWVFLASLAVGVGFVGVGVWDIVTHLDAYMAAGLEFSILGPVSFGSGILLSVASGWFIMGNMKRSKS